MTWTSARLRGLNKESRRQFRTCACSCNVLLREINSCLKSHNSSKDRSLIDSRTAYCPSCHKGLTLFKSQHWQASYPHMIPWRTSLTIPKLWHNRMWNWGKWFIYSHMIYDCMLYSSFLSVAVINTMTESNLGEKGVIRLAGYRPSHRKPKLGTSSPNNLEARTEVKTTEKCCLLTFLPWWF